MLKLPISKNTVLTILLLTVITFFTVEVIKATAPNPGHLLSDIDFNQVTKTASTTLLTTETVVFADASSKPITLFLPSATATTPHTTFYIKKIDTALANLVTIIPTSSQTIDGLTSYSLSNRGESIMLQGDGSNWRVLGRRDYDVSSYRAKGSTLNQWYSSPNTGIALGTGRPTLNALQAIPFIVNKPTTVDQMAVNVTTARAGSIRLGIYDDNGNNYPGPLVVDAGYQYGSSTGVRVFTANLPKTLDPGLYWLAYNTTSSNPNIRTFAVGSLSPVLGYASDLSLSNAQFGWSVSYTTTDNLPATYPSGATPIIAAPIPAVFVRTSQ